jgi:hypothetical protein
MAKYEIAGRVFPSKKALTEHIRAVRDGAALGGEVRDRVLLHLLRMHPEWTEKSEGMRCVGTALIQGSPAIPPRKEIAILREGLEPMDISWAKLVARLQPDGSLRHPTNTEEALAELRIATRQAIEPQIQPLRQPGMHVDHVAPLTFEQLLFTWVNLMHQRHGLDLQSLQVVANDGPVVERRLEEAWHSDHWCGFHLRCARLEVVTPEEHARRPKVQVDWGKFL